MKSIILIVLLFALGVAFAALWGLPDWFNPSDYSNYLLYVLIVVAGVSIGADKSFKRLFKPVSFAFAIFPFVVIAGTLLGSLLGGLMLQNLGTKDALAIGSGLGYYSLSSIIISEARGEALGTVALLANLIREIFTLLLAPFFVRFLGPLSTIASGGATSMDTTLPIVVKFSGKNYALLAVYNGVVLSVLVPVLVSLFV